MASESFNVTAKPQQHLRSLLLKHFPGSGSDLLQNTRRLAHFDSWFMEPALLPSESGELSWNELFPCRQPGNFPGGSTPQRQPTGMEKEEEFAHFLLRRIFVSDACRAYSLVTFCLGLFNPTFSSTISSSATRPHYFSFLQDLPQIQNNFVTGPALDPGLCM